jgi:alpha,alpha-trehalose phosphorylase
VAGFGGLRDHGGNLKFDPALPVGISRLTFTVRWRGIRLRVSFDHDEVTYSLHDGADAEIAFQHADEQIVLTAVESVTRTLKRREPLNAAPPQPVGREPARRHAG